jgi:hypothetical protein
VSTGGALIGELDGIDREFGRMAHGYRLQGTERCFAVRAIYKVKKIRRC